MRELFGSRVHFGGKIGYSPELLHERRNQRGRIVIQNGLHIELIEVKSGKDYKKHAALDKVRKVREWQAKKAYVLCQGNIEEKDGVIYLPWYEIMFLYLPYCRHHNLYSLVAHAIQQRIKLPLPLPALLPQPSGTILPRWSRKLGK